MVVETYELDISGTIVCELLTELERTMGVGNSVYNAEDFLIVNTLRPGNPVRTAVVRATDSPAIRIVHFKTEPSEWEIGTNRPSECSEKILVYGVLVLSPGGMGLTEPTLDEFLRAAYKATYAFRDRIVATLEDFELEVEGARRAVSNYHVGASGAYIDDDTQFRANGYCYVEYFIATEGG